MEAEAEVGGEEVVEEGPGNYSVVEMPEEVEEEIVEDDSGEMLGEEAAEEPVEGDSVEALESALEGEPAAEEEAEPSPETRVLTVDGREVEVTADEAFKRYELVQASYQRMEEAANVKSSVKSLFSKLRGADVPVLAQFLEKLGHNPVEFATALGQDILRRDGMTEEQRRIEDVTRENQTLRQRQQALAEQQRQAAIQARIPVEQERIHGEYMSAMDQMGIPGSEKLREGLVMRVAARQLRARQSGTDIPTDHALAMEWESLQSVAAHQTESMRKKRLAEAPARQRIAPKKRPQASSGGASNYQTYASGDLDSFKALLEAD